MNSIGERISIVRKENQLAMRPFAARIGISASAVAHLEAGENSPSERTIKLICSEFNIRREWLLTGNGEMSAVSKDDEIIDDVLAGENEFAKAVIRSVAKTPGGWEGLKAIVEQLYEEMKKSGSL